MRTEFFEGVGAVEAYELAPWAAVIVPVDGGYRAFESESDYEVWRNQT